MISSKLYNSQRPQFLHLYFKDKIFCLNFRTTSRRNEIRRQEQVLKVYKILYYNKVLFFANKTLACLVIVNLCECIPLCRNLLQWFVQQTRLCMHALFLFLRDGLRTASCYTSDMGVNTRFGWELSKSMYIRSYQQPSALHPKTPSALVPESLPAQQATLSFHSHFPSISLPSLKGLEGWD